MMIVLVIVIPSLLLLLEFLYRMAYIIPTTITHQDPAHIEGNGIVVGVMMYRCRQFSGTNTTTQPPPIYPL